jgi:hypothetical protein
VRPTHAEITRMYTRFASFHGHTIVSVKRHRDASEQVKCRDGAEGKCSPLSECCFSCLACCPCAVRQQLPFLFRNVAMTTAPVRTAQLTLGPLFWTAKVLPKYASASARRIPVRSTRVSPVYFEFQCVHTRFNSACFEF